MSDRKMVLIAISAVSFALLVDEIMLSAIFHVLLGAGNTVSAIAIALVGLSGGGICVYALPALHDPEQAPERVGSLLFWFSCALMASPFLLMSIPLHHGDLIYSRGELAIELWRLAVFHVAVAPFFLGGLVIAVILRAWASEVGKLYFADLLGAALGCLVSPLALTWLGAPRAILFAALPAAAFGIVRHSRGGRRAALAAIPLACVALSLAWPELHGFRKLNTMGEVRHPGYRSFAIGDGDLDFEKWALDAWTIIRSDRIPQQWEKFDGWGLSTTYDGPIPRFVLINYNARFSTYVTEFAGDTEPLGAWIDADLTALPFRIGRHYERVLNIGAGGGREVLTALHHGSEHVVAVDVSEVVVEDIMKGELREFSGGLYLDPRVTAVADEGRTFAERSQERFDLIEFSIVGGMNLEKMDLVRVDDLFTLEALRTYLARLEEGGVFSYVMYTTRSDLVAGLMRETTTRAHPYVPALRTLTGLRIALEERDPAVRFEDHVLVASIPRVIDPSYDLVAILVSLTPFDAAERERFVALCRELGFALLHPRDGGPLNPYAQLVAADDLDAFADDLPFSVWPATDDRPFQYALDPRRLGRAFEEGSLLPLLLENPLVSMGASIAALAIAVMLVPLVMIAVRGGGAGHSLPRSWSLLLLFACIGVGYMAIEISALLRLQSYLGKPIFGLSVGLFAFLLSSGLGSGFSGRFDVSFLPAFVVRSVGVLLILGLAFFWFVPPLFAQTLALPLAARIAVAVATIFPMAFVMGMFFPMGIQLLARESESLVPWAWAINGCMSVVGIFGTRIIAVLLGFSRALLLGLAAYVLVVGCIWVYTHTRTGAHST